MDSDQKKDYLMNYVHSLAAEQHIAQEIQECYNKIKTIKAVTHEYAKSSNKSAPKGIDHYMVMLELLKEKYENQKKESEGIKDNIKKLIRTIKDKRTREIMKLRYINCMDLKIIADIFDVSTITIRRELEKGLDLLADPETIFPY